MDMMIFGVMMFQLIYNHNISILQLHVVFIAISMDWGFVFSLFCFVFLKWIWNFERYLCNQRHAAKVKDSTAKESKSGKKKRSKKQREGADDDDEQDDGDDHDVVEDGGNDGNDSRGKKRTKTKVPVAGKGARLLLQPAYVAPRLKDFMEKGDQL